RLISTLHTEERRHTGNADWHPIAARHLIELMPQGSAVVVEAIVHLRRELAHSCQAGLHGQGVSIKRAAVGNAWGLPGGVKRLHDICTAPKSAYGQSTPNNFAHAGQVRHDVKPLLGAAWAHAYGLHFIEDEQDILAITRLTQRL